MAFQKDPEGSEAKYLHKVANFTDKRVLEIGCGEGRLTWKYARHARQVIGLDLDHDALRVATVDRPYDLAETVRFVESDSISLPFQHNTFEIAILAWSL